MKKLTPEQRVEIFEVFIDCVKTALATGQGHLVNVRKFDEYLTANTEPEDEPTCYLVKCDWKTAYLELAKMVDKQLTTHTEPEDENQITLWKWKEYEHWLGEWNGDEPAPQEHITFEDWLQEASDE